MADVGVELQEGAVGAVVLRNGPDNYLDIELLNRIADSLAELDADDRCRSIVLASEGKHFSAGARLASDRPLEASSDGSVPYEAAVRMLAGSTPIVAAVQGAALGGGLGLALVADFRVASPESRFGVLFPQLGLYPGFGLTALLPAIVGMQAALDLLYTGRRIGGDEARSLGLCDEIVPTEDIRRAASARARAIAASAPLVVGMLRRRLRADLLERVRQAVADEHAEQLHAARTEDFREGVAAMSERRVPVFQGR